ncbi:MAG: HNH endonuclease [Chloroflexota bacterium]
MSQSYIPAALRQEVIDTSRPWCCYCLTQTNITGVLLTVDHIIPEALGGMTVRSNLCLACWECNLFKGQHTAGSDPVTHRQFPLFNPDTQQWSDHFAWDETAARLVGKTPIGRVTIQVLRLNRDHLVHARGRWVVAGWHPPQD